MALLCPIRFTALVFGLDDAYRNGQPKRSQCLWFYPAGCMSAGTNRNFEERGQFQLRDRDISPYLADFKRMWIT